MYKNTCAVSLQNNNNNNNIYIFNYNIVFFK